MQDRTVCGEVRERPSDMEPGMALRIIRQEDGDFILSIGPVGHRIHEVAVEFCTVTGGTRSRHTVQALRALWDAMEADNG